MIWLRAVGFVLVVQAGVVALVPWWLSRFGPRLPPGPWRVAGLVAMVAGAGLLLVCNALFVRDGRGTAAPYDPPRKLVVRGPYRYVRNPMYVSAILIVVGLALWLRALILLPYAAVLGMAYPVFVRWYEEPRLAALFGPACARYRADVPAWWPRLRGGSRGSEEQFRP